MTRAELIELINLREEFIGNNRPNRPGTTIKPTHITIHNTSNKSRGANANMHSRFVRDTGYYTVKDSKSGDEKKHWVSWHFTVDDKSAIQHLPLTEKGYHAGNNGNNQSIAIEICMNSDNDQVLANDRAAQLTALLCYDLSIPIMNVVTHKAWAGKNCPELLIRSWKVFIDGVHSYLIQLFSRSESEGGVSMFSSVFQSEKTMCWTSDTTTTEELTSSDYEFSSFVQDGFNDQFLESGEVPLPFIKGNEDYVFLHHQNLTIYFNKQRKLALYSACNYNKDALFEPMNRSDAFRDDPDVATAHQLGKGFYKSSTLDEPNGKKKSHKYLDQGHLIARRYNQWGVNEEEAKRGERDTYFYTTIHPQVKELNRKRWENLESFIIERGKLDARRVSVISGALLLSNDPVAKYLDKFYQVEIEIQIPLVYWKVVYYQIEGELRKIAFLMSQRNRLRQLPFITFPEPVTAAPDPFETLNDPLKTYITNSKFIEKHTLLMFGEGFEKYDKQESFEEVISDNETYPAATTGGLSLLNYL